MRAIRFSDMVDVAQCQSMTERWMAEIRVRYPVRDQEFTINVYAREILERLPVSSRQRPETCLVTVDIAGLTPGPSRDDVVRKWKAAWGYALQDEARRHRARSTQRYTIRLQSHQGANSGFFTIQKRANTNTTDGKERMP